MGKSLTGPDLIDCEMMMRAMGGVHTGRVEVLLRPLGTGLNGGVEITLTMNFDVLPGSSLPKQVTSVSNYPCGTCSEFWHHVFAGLYALDFEVSKVYENSDLWEE